MNPKKELLWGLWVHDTITRKGLLISDISGLGSCDASLAAGHQKAKAAKALLEQLESL